MRKRIIKLWGPWSSKKIKEWLEIKRLDGWILKKVSFFQVLFTFEENDKSVCYQYSIDFQIDVSSQYKMICEEVGWELLSYFAGWYIWRKESNEPCNLYTDKDSLIDANKRIIMYLIIILAMQVLPIRLFLRNDISLIVWIPYAVMLFILIYACVRLVLFNITMKKEK